MAKSHLRNIETRIITAENMIFNNLVHAKICTTEKSLS